MQQRQVVDTGKLTWQAGGSKVPGRAKAAAAKRRLLVAGLVGAITLVPAVQAFACIPVVNLTGQGQSSSTILWSWTIPPGGQIDGYRVMAGTVNLSGTLAPGTSSWLQSGLPANSKYGPVFVRSVDMQNQSFTVDGSTASAYTLAAVPGNLKATAISSMSISLTWSTGGNPAGTLYQLDRSLPGGSFAQLYSGTALAFTDQNLTPATTYLYEVRAMSIVGAASAFTPVVSAMTFPPNPPAAPTGFVGTPQGTTSIRWTWVDHASNEAGYRVISGTVNVSGDLPSGTTFWLETGLSPDVDYGPFFAQAFNAGGVGDSNAASAFTLAAVPGTPVVNVISSTALNVTWFNAGNAPGTVYELQSSVDGVTFSDVYVGTTTAYQDTDLFSSTTYYYQAQALNGAGIGSGYSGLGSGMTPDPPPVPTNFLGVAQSPTSILWTWDDTEGDNDSDLFWVMSGTVNISGNINNVNSWLQTGLSTNTQYGPYYVAEPGAGNSNQASAYTLAAIPVKLAAAALSSTSIAANWAADGNPAGTGYELDRAVQGGSFAAIFSSPNLSFTDTGLTPSTTYVYEVRAFNGDGIPTAFTLPVSAVTLPMNGPAGGGSALNFAGTAQSQSAILWTWNDSAVGETGYRVVAGTVNLSGNLPAHAVSWLQTGLSTNTLYGPYVVEAFNPGGSVDSNFASRFTLAATPASMVAAALSSGSISVSWAAAGNPGGTVYELDRSTTGTGFAQLSTGTLLGFADANLAALQVYFYEARAFNGDGIPTPFAQAASTMTLAAPGGGAPGGVQADLSAMRVYPIPYKPNGTNPDEGRPFAAGDFSTGIIFDNLPATIDIKIYNVTGQLVTDLNTENPPGALQWDARNGSGHDVASGNYSAVVSTPGQKAVVKRIMIIR